MANEFTQRVALFRSEYGAAVLLGDWADSNNGYVRISEYAEIEMEPLPRDEVVERQIAALDKQAEKVVADSELALSRIYQRKQELLALPAPSESNHD